MGNISVSLPSDGTTADVADYNTPITTIVDEFNGNIDNSNISSSAAIAGSKLGSSSVTASKIDFGGSGSGVWWEEIGRTTLGSAGDTITVSSLPARKYLRLQIFVTDATNTINMSLRFNNDSANNYAERNETNGAADGTAVSQPQLTLMPGTVANPSFVVVDIINVATAEKLVMSESVSRGAAGAGNAPGRKTMMGKWANTAAQISRVDVINASTGDYATGSEVVVLGHN